MNKLKQDFKKGFYSFPNRVSKQLRKNDKKLFKGRVRQTFNEYVATQSVDTGEKSQLGYRIKFCSISFRDAFFNSTDRNDEASFRFLYSSTGAVAYKIWNYAIKEYDYIIAMNRDAYNHISDRLFELTFCHEMGHCLLDHPLHNERLDDGKRHIDIEIAADNAGFEYLLRDPDVENLDEFNDPNLISSDNFDIKHVANCGSVIYGPKNLDLMMEEYKYDSFSLLEQIAKRFLKYNSSENEEEDKARHENWVAFLQKHF